MKAIWTVLLADFTMSLDNVLGVAGAAGDHYTLLIFGLGFINCLNGYSSKFNLRLD
jgi:predicted tellurium resistance membrane protein TerC